MDIYEKLASMKKDNDIYLNNIIDLLIEKYKSDYEELEFPRIVNELSLISNGNNSKMIYDCIQLCMYCKDNNEPYYLFGGYGALFILYILEVAKMNPIELACRYETILGIPSKPTKLKRFDFRVRKEFHGAFINHIIEYFKDDYDVYFWSKQEEDKELNSVFSRLELVDKKANPNDYFDFEECDGINKITGYKQIKNIPSIEFGIESNELLDECYGIDFEMDIHESFMKLINQLLEGNYSIIDINNPIMKVDNIFSPLQLASLISYHFSNYDNDEDNMFDDRDSVYSYFRFGVELSQEEAYSIMEETRRGKFNESNHNTIFISDKVINDLKACQYLCRKGDIAERLYFYLLRMNIERQEYII